MSKKNIDFKNTLGDLHFSIKRDYKEILFKRSTLANNYYTTFINCFNRFMKKTKKTQMKYV